MNRVGEFCFYFKEVGKFWRILGAGGEGVRGERAWLLGGVEEVIEVNRVGWDVGSIVVGMLFWSCFEALVCG